MPHVPAMPPADRFWARLDRFELTCPTCNHVFQTWYERKGQPLPDRLRRRSERRAYVKMAPTSPKILKLIFNPLTQRLECPWCGAVYVAGLVLYSQKRGSRRHTLEPPDVKLTAHERAALRADAGGWWLRQLYDARQAGVNLAIDEPCNCAKPYGYNTACPVHGERAKVGGNSAIDDLAQR